MTIKEMKIKCKELGLTGFWKLKKAELEALLENEQPKLHDSDILFTGKCSGDGEWLQHRRIGATETSVLVLCNSYLKGFIDAPDKYNSPYLMYMERKGLYKREISFTSQVAMDFGHFAEDFIISYLPNLFKNEFGIDVEEVKKGNQIVANKDYPLWSCTPDSWVKIDGEWYPVELKTGNSYTSWEWEREEVPNKYYAQVQQQLAVLGKEKGYLIGFVDNRFTKLYEIKKDSKLIEYVYELTKEFKNCLDNDITPELVGNKVECEFLKQEFKGFKNSENTTPNIDIKESIMLDFIDMEETKKEISKEAKEIDKTLDKVRAFIQNEMLRKETEKLTINNQYLATWKIDARGYKRFNIKRLAQ